MGGREIEEINANLRNLELQNQVAIRTPPAAEENVGIPGYVVELPDFYEDCVYGWFRQVEAMFCLGNVTEDAAKYEYVIAKIKPKDNSSPPETGRYEWLKQKIIEQTKFRRYELLLSATLGDKRPSQLWYELRGLVGPELDENDIFLYCLWQRCLPREVQLILAAQPEDLPATKRAEIADCIFEVMKLSQDPLKIELENLKSKVEMLEKEVAILSSRNRRPDTIRPRNQRQGRSNSRGRRGREQSNTRSHASRSPSQRNCWFHQKFGRLARRCVQPCAWSEENSERIEYAF